MVYMLEGKVSWLRLIAIIWTASSDAAREEACGEAAARWGNAQAVTELQLQSLTVTARAFRTARRRRAVAPGHRQLESDPAQSIHRFG
jgi:hypothetical protein